jgi:pimeloyl-ACP methyl ester carboxylesterase
MELVLQLTEEYYQVNGIRMHTVESGPEDGPVVIFLHGFPEFWYGWRKQIGFFAEQGYRVVVPDQRGYNLTGKPVAIAAYQMRALMQDVVELVAVLGAGKVYLVGHDWGGAVAWGLAAFHPHLLHRVAIINMPHPTVMHETLRTRLGQLRRSWYVFFFQLPLLPQWLISLGRYYMMRRSLRKTSLPSTFSDEDLRHYVNAWSRPGSFRSMVNWYRAALRYQNPGAVNQGTVIDIPLLLLWGDQDAFLRADMAPKSMLRCRQGQLKMFPGATHWVHHERSIEVNEAMHDFFREGRQGV